MFFHRQKEKVQIQASDSKEINITELRKKVKILFVDNEKYDIIEFLKNRSYDVYYKKDIRYPIESEPFDIVILDIKGVAKVFGSTYEGLGYAKEVKLRYPNKIVLCYSSSSSDPSFSEQLSSIDGFIQKDTDPDRWADKLDDYIKKYSDINYQWQVIKKQLEKFNVGIEAITIIEDHFKKGFQNDKIDEIRDCLKKNVNDAQFVINSINTLMSILSYFKA